MNVNAPILLGKTDDGVSLDQSQWSVEQDAAVMSWATLNPSDWQVGGRCMVYMWGSGRHGQLAESGNKNLYLGAIIWERH